VLVLPSTLKYGGIKSVMGTFLYIISLDQDQTGVTSKRQSKEPKEFSSITKFKKLHKKTRGYRTS